MPTLTKIDNNTFKLNTKRKNKTPTKQELDSQIMHTFSCPKCAMIVKSITRKAEFFCGNPAHRGYKMELK